ncbi:hypothetical protein RclHR1_02510024 [Rhizophagus clarus]|uniref:PDCD2_C domain protein n=1 Tax=Rhizophagus clarus TaxID=94130 RepID=A0A2Z6QZ74_9GLOM|nr:hypothetical protein RclHR1_02510024 [Rhizophagus clarus]GES98616.1 PDCD2_C domain protein [Rhizophagus clarus]
MDPKKSRYDNIKFSDNDHTSKSKPNKPNRSKNKSKSKKKQSPIDKIKSITTSSESSNSQNIYDFQRINSNSSNKSLIDKKKFSQNDDSSTIQKRYIPQKESKSRRTTQTSILLGFPDGNILAQEDNDPYTTKIGGKPNWLLESHPLSYDVIICKNCGKEMFLLFQGYVPLEDSIYDRVIYIFGCNQHKCINKNGSFRAFRAHRKNEEYGRYQQERANKCRSGGNSNNSSVQSSSNVINGGLGDMLFGVVDFDNTDDMQISDNDISRKEEDDKKEEDNHDDDEWPELGTNNKISSTTAWQSSWSQVISDAEKARNEKDQIKDQVSSKHDDDDNMSQIDVEMSTLTLNTCWPKNIKSFPAHYLYITEEVLEEKGDDIPAKYLSYEEVQENEDNFDWYGEKYEKPILPKGYDKTFKKFSDRVAEWPDQCVRYQFDGQPLLYTHNDVTAKLLLDNCNDKITSSKLPVCRWCKSTRVFELQLMPSMLTTLSTSSYIEENEINSDKKNDNSIFNLGMEWGTILVFTCKNNCEMNECGFNEVSYYEEVVFVQYEQ